MKNSFLKYTLILFVLLFLQTTGFAQQKPNEKMTQLLDNSRPGENHQLLGQLAGSWNFQDTKLVFVKGTLIRKPIYDGRFYSVTITGGKLPLPVADGKMKEDNYQSQQLEGYDNPREKFFTTSINNHIGSDIELQSGNYDPAKKEFTYEWESELIKGQLTQDRRIVHIVDAGHYTETYYEKQNGVYVRVRELDYTKTGD